MIAILDYGVGNLKSIRNMFKKVGVESIITNEASALKKANKLLLPGVGSFDYCIKKLRESTFFEVLEEEVLMNKKPILGICLGMQLLTCRSDEGSERGLGWINAETLRFNLNREKFSVPHMGWNVVKPSRIEPLFLGLEGYCKFYFVHSYFVKCNNENNILATTDYGGEFTCSINKNNIFGVQFHPEKSHKYGMQLLENFANL